MIEPLYHQVVAGNKTQTRRAGGLDVVNNNPDKWDAPVKVILPLKGGLGIEAYEFMRPNDRGLVIQCTPRYKVDEIIYIKEPYKYGGGGVYLYKFHDPIYRDMYDWKNKMFMPMEAARTFIQITGIRCERLLDISDADCIAEGIEHPISKFQELKESYLSGWKDYFDPNIMYMRGFEKKAFISLFRFANKMSPKQKTGNPWVWVYEFKYLPNFKK